MTELTCVTRDGGKIKILFFEAKNSNLPLLLEMHGGGYYGGTASDDINLCETLCNECGVNVASVDYRHATKFTYPTATDDCCDALKYLIGNEKLDFDRSRIIPIGHSAGANAAAVVSMQMQEYVCAQILDYPWLDVRSVNRPKKAFGIPKLFLTYMAKKYFKGKGTRELITASPLLMNKEQASKMPRTLIITAGNDCLHVDGIDFYELLKKSGVSVEMKEYEKAVHGFIEMHYAGTLAKKCYWLRESAVALQADYCRNFISDVKNFAEEFK